MTDEEMAEKWVIANTGFNPKEPLGKIAVRTFIAGLKAGRETKWHNLRENQNDLPESSIFHEVLNQNGIKMYYDDILKKWNMHFSGGIVQAQTPIAWCEIPKYTEE